MDDCGGVRTVHGGHAGLASKHLLNLVLDRVVEHIPYSLVDVKPHGRTGIDSGRARRKAKRLAKGLTHVALPLSLTLRRDNETTTRKLVTSCPM